MLCLEESGPDCIAETMMYWKLIHGGDIVYKMCVQHHAVTLISLSASCCSDPDLNFVRGVSQKLRGIGKPYLVDFMFIWVLMSLSTHCIGLIMTDIFMGRGNQFYSWSRFCTVYCQPTASNYHLRGKSFTTLPLWRPILGGDIVRRV